VSDPFVFALAALALLATPGPTNMLLATSGAAAGVMRSLKLLAAEMSGYLASILALTLVVAPLTRGARGADVVLQIACATYLFYAAWKLWRARAAAVRDGAPESFRRVLIATALNPKALVFAFVIVPHLRDGDVAAAAPYLAALLALIALTGGAWIAIGAVFRANGAGAWARGAGALVLCVFAVLLLAAAA
jgi:threonine/homoserine/homoserine lactone efflux protein